MTQSCFASCSSWKGPELTQPSKACNTKPMENKLIANGGGVLSFSPPGSNVIAALLQWDLSQKVTALPTTMVSPEDSDSCGH